MSPAPRTVALLLAWAALGLAASLGAVPAAAWMAAGGALALLLAIDALLGARLAPPGVARVVPAAFALGRDHAIALDLEAASRPLRFEIADHAPEGWSVSGLPLTVALAAGEHARIEYQARPLRRGAARFAPAEVRLSSPFGLWRRDHRVGAESAVRAYPNFRPMARFALWSAERASRELGAHQRRRRGDGTEFHQLRDYRVGDALRQIDWKATARQRRLISREYQDERNQQVVLLLDTGRRMLAHDGELSHFDHALNATLALGYIALRQGDSVGMLAWGGTTRWLPPVRGPGAFRTLIEAVHDLEPQPVATDFLAAATALELRQRRRAMVVMLTNLRDDRDEVAAAAALLRRKHFVCIASLRESEIDQALERDLSGLDDALRAAGAAQFLQDRAAAHRAMAGTRSLLLDVRCEELSAKLVESYLAVKRSGAL